MTTCKVWNWVAFSKSLPFITLEFPSHWHLGRALLPAGLESGLHCRFAHPELKLLAVGLTGPVAPTYAWISASARITVYPSEVSACITSFWNSLWNLVLDSFSSQSTLCLLCCSMQLVGLRGVFHTIILLEERTIFCLSIFRCWYSSDLQLRTFQRALLAARVNVCLGGVSLWNGYSQLSELDAIYTFKLYLFVQGLCIKFLLWSRLLKCWVHDSEWYKNPAFQVLTF